MNRSVIVVIASIAILALGASIWPCQSHAAPAEAFVYQESDVQGNTFDVRVWGDEFYQRVETLDGYTLVRDPKTGSFCYAVPADDGNGLISSGKSPALVRGRELGLEKHLAESSEIIAQKATARRKHMQEQVQKRWQYLQQATPADKRNEPSGDPPTLGEVRSICVMVDFSDEPGVRTRNEVLDFLNQEDYSLNGNNGSVRDYFHDVSDGQLTYTHFVPDYYHRASHPRSYYDDDIWYNNTRELVEEILQALDDSGLDFSEYDSNDDGILDGLSILYAGTRKSGGLWPHSWTVEFAADGIETYRYALSDMSTQLELGTFCHEVGHMLCWWHDFYDISYTHDGKNSSGLGNFCLMAWGSTFETNPPEPNGYIKARANWADLRILSSPQKALQTFAGQNRIYKFPHPTSSTDYYIIESRLKQGRDSNIPDEGLAIYRVDETCYGNTYEFNAPDKHYECLLIQADGQDHLTRDRIAGGGNKGDENDLYDASYRDVFGPATIPNSKWWDGSESGLKIHEISEIGETMTFHFGDILSVSPDHGYFPGGPPAGPFLPASQTYTLTNTSGNSISWSASSTASWIDFSPASGSMPPGTSLDVQVSVNSAAESLEVGQYEKEIVFSDMTHGVSVEHECCLYVQQRPSNAVQWFPMNEDPGWTMTGDWEFGSPLGRGAYKGDPLRGKTGGYVYGNDLNDDGNYPQTIDDVYILQTTALDCSGYKDLRLGFQRWLGMNTGYGMDVSVDVSINGTHWQQLWTYYNDRGQMLEDGAWKYREYDISSIADNSSTVYVRWTLGPIQETDIEEPPHPGWNIDDVVILGNSLGSEVFFYDLETSPSIAKKDAEVTLSFSVSQDLADNPSVKINGHDASHASTNGRDYVYSYTIQSSDPDGYADIEIAGESTGGTPGSRDFNNNLLVDKVPPLLDYFWVNYDDAKTGTNLEFNFGITGETTDVPEVTFNGNPCTIDTQNATGDTVKYVYAYTVSDQDVDGYADIMIRCSDLAGNVAEIHRTDSVKVDRTPPQLVTLECTPSRAKAGDRVDISFTVNERQLGYPTVKVNDNKCNRTYDYIYDFTYRYTVQEEDDEGSATLTFKMQDTVRNRGTVTTNTVLYIDKTPPGFDSFIAEPAVAMPGQDVTIWFQASEPLEGEPTLSVNGDSAIFEATESGGQYRFSYAIPADAPEGYATLQASGTDTVGFENSAVNETALNIQSTIPVSFLSTQTLQVEGPGNFEAGAWNYTEAAWTAYKSDAAPMELQYGLTPGDWICLSTFNVDEEKWTEGIYLYWSLWNAASTSILPVPLSETGSRQNREDSPSANMASEQNFIARTVGNSQVACWDYSLSMWVDAQEGSAEEIAVSIELISGHWYCVTLYDMDQGTWESGIFIFKENW
ncbi:MAG: M6 family metalloprotease domain-containing protein [Candidatus Sumerlaeia bacterium]